METVETLTRTVEQSVGKNALLSEEIMPAIPGEFYSYSADFTKERPLYFLMKCKSQKSRMLCTNAGHIVQELDLTFIFEDNVILCSPNSTPSLKLLENVISDLNKINQTEIKIVNMSRDTFFNCFDMKDEFLLVSIFNKSGESKSQVILSNDLILSVKTGSGKYGLILIKELTHTKCGIDACHILL